LDAGCGVGVLGICAAQALTRAGVGPLLVRSQDRDELARIFTQENAARNGLGPALLRAHTEALLDCPPGERWDLILSNIPAKAGLPVLEDFVNRSAALLSPGGRVMLVAVATLADFFRTRLREAAATILREEAGTEHRVFVYTSGAAGNAGAPEQAAPEPRVWRPCYLRSSARYEMEGVGYRITAVHGAAEFDRPGGAAEAAAKLLSRLGPLFPTGKKGEFRALIHEGGQGHFPLWFLEFLKKAGQALPELLVLRGRNILALEAAQGNIAAAGHTTGGACRLCVSPGVVLNRPPARPDRPDQIDRGLGEQRCAFIAAFPPAPPKTASPASPIIDPYRELWDSLEALLLPGGTALLAFPAAEADRFDRKKIAGFSRLGDLKRRGFRALAYQRQGY
jgi:hypothetical protein